jgi:hypothetical protein
MIRAMYESINWTLRRWLFLLRSQLVDYVHEIVMLFKSSKTSSTNLEREPCRRRLDRTSTAETCSCARCHHVLEPAEAFMNWLRRRDAERRTKVEVSGALGLTQVRLRLDIVTFCHEAHGSRAFSIAKARSYAGRSPCNSDSPRGRISWS